MRKKAKGKLGIVNHTIVLILLVFVVAVLICFARLPETGAYFSHQQQSQTETIVFESSE